MKVDTQSRRTITPFIDTLGPGLLAIIAGLFVSLVWLMTTRESMPAEALIDVMKAGF